MFQHKNVVQMNIMMNQDRHVFGLLIIQDRNVLMNHQNQLAFVTLGL